MAICEGCENTFKLIAIDLTFMQCLFTYINCPNNINVYHIANLIVYHSIIKKNYQYKN